jgi:adenylylsulfate kinase
MCGLSGSGKTTIAKGVEKELYKRGFLTQVLDGDNVRDGINRGLSFSSEDREENIRRIAEVSKLFLNCGVIVINCFVSPEAHMREKAKQIIGENDFLEIYVNTPLIVCEERDVKGLYKKARKGEIKNFTGIDAPFEAPIHPDLEIKTNEITVEKAVEKVVEFLLSKISK